MVCDSRTGPRSGAATAGRLLRAASEFIGSNKVLAERLQVSQSQLILYMAGAAEIPQQVLLRTVDIILEERESRSAHG